MELITHIEVVLGDWQLLPDSLLTLSDDWKYISGGIYTIVHTDLTRALTKNEEALFTQLQKQDAIIAASTRMRTITTPVETGEKLPDWIEPEAK